METVALVLFGPAEEEPEDTEVLAVHLDVVLARIVLLAHLDARDSPQREGYRQAGVLLRLHSPTYTSNARP